MRRLPQGVAVAVDEADRLELLPVLLPRLRRNGSVEVVLGVGPCSSPPARCVGFAGKAADLIRSIDHTVGIRDMRIRAFSTAAKVRSLAGTNLDVAGSEGLPGLLALVAALRAAGVDKEIFVDLAAPEIEVPTAFLPSVPPEVLLWLRNAAETAMNGVHALDYAREHAGPSMFGDLGQTQALRIWIGPAPEARFWAARVIARESAREAGWPVASSLGFVLAACKRAWYQATAAEPALSDLAHRSPENVANDLDQAASPAAGGNSGLKSEARAARRMLGSPLIHEVAEDLAAGQLQRQLHRLESIAIVGSRLRNAVDREMTP